MGKSAFNKYCSTRFEDSVEELHEQVYGVSFAVKILKAINIEITLVVWNFTGQERYKYILPHYMQGVAGILLLFDLTRKETFNKLPEWIKFIGQNGGNFPIFLIGSKADLFHLKQVNDSEIEEFVNTNELQGYYEVSFKTGLNVERVIEKMSELIYKARVEKEYPVIKFKLKRPYSDRPLILDEQKVLSDFILTLQTIYDMVFNELADRIKYLENYLEDVGKEKGKAEKEWVLEEIEKPSSDLTEQNTKITDLLESPPLPLTANLKATLTEEWNSKKEILVYRILVFKDVFSFLDKLH